MFRRCWTLLGVLALAGLHDSVSIDDARSRKPFLHRPERSDAAPDFKIQGEYVGLNRGP